jgi:hypothetical protein
VKRVEFSGKREGISERKIYELETNRKKNNIIETYIEA